MLAAMRWQKVTLIGAGLLGGSLGMAVRHRKIAGSVHAFVRREASLRECLKSGAADFATSDLREAVTDADLVVLCTPIGQMRELAEKMLPALKPGTRVTDVGSTKRLLVEELGPLFQSAGAKFIGSHPMAGSDRAGIENATADLFKKAVCAITPTRSSDARSVEEITEFWKALGCSPLLMSPDQHDELVSRCSHLPHILSTGLAHYVLSPEFPEAQRLLCGTGFKDTSRLASGSPEIWRDICMTNRENLISAIDDFSAHLARFKGLLENADPAGLSDYFSSGKKLRDQWVQEQSGPET